MGLGRRTDEPPPAQEGLLEPFLGEPLLDVQPLFQGGRFPSVVVALDGTVLAFWGPNTPPAIEGNDFIPGRGSTHGADSGITLRHGEHRGRP